MKVVFVVVEFVFTNIDLDDTFIPHIRSVHKTEEGALAYAREKLGAFERDERMGLETCHGYIEIQSFDVLG